jgi:antitoxin MazE
MRVQIQKWGNSLALRIPKPFAEETKVREGTVVDLAVSEGKLVVAPFRRGRVRLDELLAKITKANLHKEVDTGPRVGRETW